VKRRGRAGRPEIPDWIRHEHDGGFVVSEWLEASDFEADPRVAEGRAKQRWMTERNRWLDDHPDVSDVLMQQLRDLARDVR
jgi:hypothetical protein